MSKPATNAKGIADADLIRMLDQHKAFHDRIPGGQRASLKFGILSGLNLSGRCLAEADLSGAKLRHADLRGADLRGANLFGADLTGADLTDAKLESADLRGATLRDAKLTRANLTRVDLREGMLMAASKGHLQHSHDDVGTVMAGASARGAMLRNARLSNSVLMQADLRDFGPQPQHTGPCQSGQGGPHGMQSFWCRPDGRQSERRHSGWCDTRQGDHDFGGA